ncbi:UbiD family decarboxylase [Mesoterricola silvestris]|uniref:3,4-dihydroxybenzoate decarboxylase n=1 Tax=Mesoterricola silvestris TaxID=2927979 RepID=A0AA48KCU9_9BACT|nr:UbiD family decarboxylase [Mesoterricola silvestris]BDU73883.1 3,4-dihydroxybenzoate decarboxylase [Mesoterricola silvestris]
MSPIATAVNVHDLRSALELLGQHEGQLHQTDVEVDPVAELSGVYRYIGAGGTVMRPTKLGPAMLFNNIKGFPGSRVSIGMLADRRRVALLLGTTVDKVGTVLCEALNNPIVPKVVKAGSAVCQEVVHKATDPGFDIRTLIPAPTNTPEDAGPFITMGLCYGKDPENGQEDVTIHRLCVQGKDEISMMFVPGRHLDSFRIKAEKAGKPQPISISIGLDPAVYVAACFEAPSTPLGFNELGIAGAVRGQAVEVVECLTVDAKAIANAEIVIEGFLQPDVRVVEDQNSHTGKAMPEFPGYNGPAHPSLPVIKVTAVTHRVNPIMQTTIGPSEEHVNLAGIPTEASITTMVGKALPGFLQNVYAHPSGGGKYLAILQVKKAVPFDEGRQRQAALLAFSSFSELKHVILVDEDVDPFDTNDVLWAMTTRFQADADVIAIPGVRCHPLDPSQTPEMSPSIRGKGIATKAIFDCTVPFELKARFQRAQFMEVDYKRFL